MGASEADPIGTPEGVEPSGPEPEVQPTLSPYAQNFLGGIQDEAEKAILQRYLPQWDSGFTKQMQKHSAAAQAYRQFGSPDDVAKYANLYRSMESDLPGTIGKLVEAGLLKREDLFPDPVEPDPDEFKLPAPINDKLSKIDQVERAVNYMLQSQQQQDNIRKQQEEDAALDAAVASLEKKYGSFEKEPVFAIAQANGGDLESAVQTWNQLVQAAINKRSAPQAPRIMSGATLPPLDKDPNQLSRDERKALIAQKLSMLNQG